MSFIQGARRVRLDVVAHELDVIDTFDRSSMNEKRSVLCPPGSPVVNYDLLGHTGVQDKSVV